MDKNSKFSSSEKHVEPSPASLDMRGRIDEIRALEQKVLNLKQGLLFKAATVEIESAEEELSFLVLRAGPKSMAAPITYMDEVVQMPALLPLPEKIPGVCGLVNFHGEMIAVIDVASLINEESNQIDPNSVLIICTVEGRRLALMVEEAVEVVTVNRESVTVSDKVLPGVFKTAGVLKLDDAETILILDVAWVALGIQLAGITSEDAATPCVEESL